MIRGPYEIADDSEPAGHVDSAEAILCLYRSDGILTYALDTHDRFVRIDSTPPGSTWRPLALNPDGTSLLGVDHPATQRHRTWLQPLAGGQPRWFDAHVDGYDRVGAISPNGHTLAVLSDADDPTDDDPDASLAVVSLIDLTDGHRSRLGRKTGGWSNETAIGWSPDGRHIAATYLPNRPATMVLDRAGVLVLHLDGMYILPSPGTAWTSPHHIVCCHDHGPDSVSVVDVRDGSRRPLGLAKYPIAVIGDRYVMDASSNSLQLVTVDENGHDERLLITGPPLGLVWRFDIATSTTPNVEK